MSGLDDLRHLEVLNLSCNKIAQIFGLRQMAKSLKTLNLSHNRIVSLQPMQEIADVSVLQVLDLTDNYIGELQHVKYLTNFRNLRELSFQKADDSSKGANPICDFLNYATTVQMYLPSIQQIDGQAKSESAEIRPQTAPLIGGRLATAFTAHRDQQNYAEPVFTEHSPQGRFGIGSDRTTILQLQQKLAQKESILDKLH